MIFFNTIVLESLFSPPLSMTGIRGVGTAVVNSQHRTAYFVKANLWMVELNSSSVGNLSKQTNALLSAKMIYSV